MFVLAYFRPGIITTRDIFRMQKIRVVILGFFLPQIKICTMISAFIDRRRRLILCYENDVEIIFHANVQLLFCLFVCLFVCFCLFLLNYFDMIFLFSYGLHQSFVFVLFCGGIHKQHQWMGDYLIKCKTIILWRRGP